MGTYTRTHHTTPHLTLTLTLTHSHTHTHTLTHTLTRSHAFFSGVIADFNVKGVAHGCMIVRARLLFFVRVLDEYTTQRALIAPIAAFEAKAKRAQTVDGLHRLHSEFLDTVKRRVLLPGVSEPCAL